MEVLSEVDNDTDVDNNAMFIFNILQVSVVAGACTLPNTSASGISFVHFQHFIFLNLAIFVVVDQ